MTRTKVFVLACFIVAFAAGVAAGLLVGRSGPGGRHRSRLAGELDLTAEQREQMREIWSRAMSTAGRGRRARMTGLREERDNAVRALLTEEQQAAHDRIFQEYSQNMAEMGEERRALFEEATQQTKEILTEEQRVKYEEMLETEGPQGWRRRRGDRPGGPMRPPDPHRGEEQEQ